MLNSIYLLFSPLVCNECKRFPMEINGEKLTGCKGGRWRSAVLYLCLALCSNSTKAVDKYWPSCVAIQDRMQNLCTLMTRPGRWCLSVKRSCPACQRALSATLFSDKALVKELTPAGHGCWGGESSSSTPDLLACRSRLSQPPSLLPGLSITIHSRYH